MGAGGTATDARHHQPIGKAIDERTRPTMPTRAVEVLLVLAVVLLALGYVHLDRQLTEAPQAPSRGVVDMGPLPEDGAASASEPYGNRSLLDPERPEGRALTTDRTTVTNGLVEYRETVRIGEVDNGALVDALTIQCHGGMANIQWQIGNLEGITSFAGLTLKIVFDGDPIASVIKGADGHVYQDTPLSFSAVHPCPAGERRIALELSRVDGGWGFPYVVNPGDDPALTPVLRGFVVTEVWASDDT